MNTFQNSGEADSRENSNRYDIVYIFLFILHQGILYVGFAILAYDISLGLCAITHEVVRNLQRFSNNPQVSYIKTTLLHRAASMD